MNLLFFYKLLRGIKATPPAPKNIDDSKRYAPHLFGFPKSRPLRQHANIRGNLNRRLANMMKLDYVLQLSTRKILDRRLQTKVFNQGLAKSIHHARVLIKQRHIRVGKQMANSASFMVRVDSEKHIDFAMTSPFGAEGRPGRKKRKKLKSGGGDDE